MKKVLKFLFLFQFLISVFRFPVFAENKNIFGLHLTQLSDLDKAAPVINSAGGDWGWATIVIRLDQLDKNTWQSFFNQCRQLHIIPIIRLSTIMDSGNWKRPVESDIDHLAGFLNQLNWPQKDRHIILFNEPNHKEEWGGGVDPKSFADISIYTYQKFKSVNPDFYLISTGLDLAAPNRKPDIMSAEAFYREIFQYRPEYFDHFDALASHSYPNHGYIGLPTDRGLHSIRGYLSELQFLKKMGVKKTYPVFITETGWPHREGEEKNSKYYTAYTSAKLLLQALAVWEKDPQIKAVTPFIYNYPYPPFDHFSWVDKSENLYDSYQKVVDSPKSKNQPEQITKYEFASNSLPLILKVGQEYSGKIILKNSGQSIWGETRFCLKPKTSPNITITSLCTGNFNLYPGYRETFIYHLTINPLAQHTDRTHITWGEGLPVIELLPVNKTGNIFTPKTSVLNSILSTLHAWFI